MREAAQIVLWISLWAILFMVAGLFTALAIRSGNIYLIAIMAMCYVAMFATLILVLTEPDEAKEDSSGVGPGPLGHS